MSDYKRMTKDKPFEELDLKDEWGYTHIYKKLQELENKKENGTLKDLPCKVGQEVYVDRYTWGNQHIVYFDCIGNKMFYYGEIVSFVITKKQFLMKIRVYKSSSHLSYETKRYPISAIGKTVFLTKAEAKKKLEELRENYDKVKKE